MAKYLGILACAVTHLTYFVMLVPFRLDTHLSRLPCSGHMCLGPKSPLNLFSGKKGSLGIPVRITQVTTMMMNTFLHGTVTDIKKSL